MQQLCFEVPVLLTFQLRCCYQATTGGLLVHNSRSRYMLTQLIQAT